MVYSRGVTTTSKPSCLAVAAVIGPIAAALVPGAGVPAMAAKFDAVLELVKAIKSWPLADSASRILSSATPDGATVL